MKVRFICDCCDTVFKEARLPRGQAREDIGALTGETGQGIIIKDSANDDLYVSSTCHECQKDLGLAGDDDRIFYGRPVLH